MPGKRAYRLQDLSMDLLTVNKCGALTADDIRNRLALSMERRRQMDEDIQTCHQLLKELPS